MAFDIVAAYQAAKLGDVITVPAGSYPFISIPYRSDLVGKGDVNDPTKLITLDFPNPVTIDGLEVRGGCVYLKGRSGFTLNVNGRLEVISLAPGQHPHNFRAEFTHMSNFGLFTVENAIMRDCDVGPSTVASTGSGCYIKEGGGDENKISGRFGAGAEDRVPNNILLERVKIHNQNGDKTRELGDCHFGGFFLVNVDGLTLRNCTFERNVVYHIQIQNFSGPPVSNVLIDGCSFGAPVDWVYKAGDVPDGQRAVQFDYDPGTQVTLTNNVCANGPGGLYGCYVGDCGGLTGVKTSGNVDMAVSTTAPPIGNTPPPPPPPPPPKTPAQLWSELQSSTLYAKWAAANPGENAKLSAYFKSGGAKPAVKSAFAVFLADACEAIS